MLLFLCAAILTVGVCAILVRPLLQKAEPLAGPEMFNAAVYRDQLAEFDAQGAAQGVDAADLLAARAEVERRLLVAAQPAGGASPHASDVPPAQGAAVAVLLLAPILAGALYLSLGDPDQAFGRGPSAPPSEMVGDDPMHAQMDEMVTALSARLAAAPDDPQGWALLARTQIRLGRNAEAVEAYARAHELVEGADRQLAAEYAEARVIAGEGWVDEVSKEIFNAMLAASPSDPQARYYLALARGQGGDLEGALRDWRALLSDTPPDAPWRETVERQIASAEAASGAAPSPQGPTREQIAAAEALAPEDRAAMINDMVAGLEDRLRSAPDDLEGWRRLARAYDVLGRSQDAERAHGRVLALAPGDAQALWRLGEIAADRGDPAQARRRWEALEQSLPRGSQERRRVREAIEAL